MIYDLLTPNVWLSSQVDFSYRKCCEALMPLPDAALVKIGLGPRKPSEKKDVKGGASAHKGKGGGGGRGGGGRGRGRGGGGRGGGRGRGAKR